jgi:hypothetical protein
MQRLGVILPFRKKTHQIQGMFANSFVCDYKSKPIKILQGAASEQHIPLASSGNITIR